MMIEIIAVVFGMIGTALASFFWGGAKERTKIEKEFNDALEREAQRFADMAHTDDEFIRMQQERIDTKH